MFVAPRRYTDPAASQLQYLERYISQVPIRLDLR